MGCDIHGHLEIKLAGKWRHYSVTNFERDYELFSKIAGVREHNNKVAPISMPKGLPRDLSEITKLDADRWGEDGHSHTWLSAGEIATLSHYMDARDVPIFMHDGMGWLFGNGWEYFNKFRDDCPPEVEDIRLICWFDN